VSKRSRSLAKGAIAGLLGGLIAAAAKSAAEKIYPPHTSGQPKSPAVLTPRPGDQKLSLEKRRPAQKTHWALGAATGAAYGALAELYPPATAKQGATFGMALIALNHDNALPFLGSAVKPELQTKRERTSELASYVVYGVVTETVRSIVRRMIR